MNAFDPSKTSPADAQKLVTQIAAMLGLDESASHDEIDQALDVLFAAVTGVAPTESSVTEPRVHASNARGLTAQQLAICAERGITPADFIEARNAFNRPLAPRR